MESQVLYEASFTFQPSWLVILCFLIIFPYLVIQNVKTFQKKKTKDSIVNVALSVLGMLVILFVAIVVFPDQIRMYANTVGAYKRGDYQIIEGYIEDFHPMPKKGHDIESFTINGVSFEYGYTGSFGYHRCKKDGGVITDNGQHLRIGYTNYRWLGNVIVYIEELP